jgi:hypothetical protein
MAAVSTAIQIAILDDYTVVQVLNVLFRRMRSCIICGTLIHRWYRFGVGILQLCGIKRFCRLVSG